MGADLKAHYLIGYTRSISLCHSLGVSGKLLGQAPSYSMFEALEIRILDSYTSTE